MTKNYGRTVACEACSGDGYIRPVQCREDMCQECDGTGLQFAWSAPNERKEVRTDG